MKEIEGLVSGSLWCNNVLGNVGRTLEKRVKHLATSRVLRQVFSCVLQTFPSCLATPQKQATCFLSPKSNT